MKIFISVGEPSGDLHGANLVRHLRRQRPKAKLVGYGGTRMAEAGCELLENTSDLAVMWLSRVILRLGTFLRLLLRANRYFRDERPDAVVLIDFPGFNWWIARRAKAHGIPVFYYGAPQIWAWARWRVGKMRRLIDHVLCKLPFEEDWYRRQGCNATYVGHPYFDELRGQRLDEDFIAQHQAGSPLVAILPGSRTQEVTGNFRWLLRAAEHTRAQVPAVRFAVACYRESHARRVRKMLAGSDLPIEVFVRQTPELIHLASCCMAVSGSVSLELLYHAKPTVILYWVSRPAYFIQRFFRKVKYITLVNLLSTEELFPRDLRPYDPQQPDAASVLMPEYLTCQDRSPQIARHVVEWLTDPDQRDQRVAALAALRDRVGHGGASQRAADYLLGALDQSYTQRHVDAAAPDTGSLPQRLAG
ncbi:MAG: lipid-A-disaccharide synthase [Pirellulales bacterium]